MVASLRSPRKANGWVLGGTRSGGTRRFMADDATGRGTFKYLDRAGRLPGLDSELVPTNASYTM